MKTRIEPGEKSMKKIVVAGIAVIAALVLVGSGAWTFPNFGTTETAEPITIGESSYELSSLIYIAENQGFLPRMGSM